MSSVSQPTLTPTGETEKRLKSLYQRLSLLDDLIDQLEAYQDLPALSGAPIAMEPPVPALKHSAAAAGR